MIVEVSKEKRTPELISRLVHIWREATLSTHHFLSKAEIRKIEESVPAYLQTLPTLLVCKDGIGLPVGFLLAEGDKLEALYIHPKYFRRGLGGDLVTIAIVHFGVRLVSAYAENTAAVEFYKALGFTELSKEPDSLCDSKGHKIVTLKYIGDG